MEAQRALASLAVLLEHLRVLAAAGELPPQEWSSLHTRCDALFSAVKRFDWCLQPALSCERPDPEALLAAIFAVTAELGETHASLDRLFVLTRQPDEDRRFWRELMVERPGIFL